MAHQLAFISQTIETVTNHIGLTSKEKAGNRERERMERLRERVPNSYTERRQKYRSSTFHETMHVRERVFLKAETLATGSVKMYLLHGGKGHGFIKDQVV
jgi:ribosomal protein S15P/S13E